MEIRLLQLERALHGIAEEHGASLAGRDDKPVVAERVPRSMSAVSPGAMRNMSPSRGSSRPAAAEDLHDLPAAVTGVGPGDEPLPVGAP